MGRGIEADPLEMDKKWDFVVSKDMKAGKKVKEGDILGLCRRQG